MLIKQGVDISFAQGLDTKTDPNRVQMGNFRSLENTVFNKGGLLQKRNGYGSITSLPSDSYTYLTTLNGNLTAIGQNIAAYNQPDDLWVNRGELNPLSLRTLPLIRNNFNQTASDSAVASNGLVCTAYLESNGSTTVNKYVIADSTTGQNIVAPVAIPISSGAVSGGMRVFVLGTYFVIVFTNTITAVAHLQYIAISINNPSNVTANADIAASYVSATTLAYDGYVVNNKLFIAYNTTSGGQAVDVTYLTSSLVLAPPVAYAGQKATLMSVTADISIPASPIIYVSFASDTAGTTTGKTLAVDQNLNPILAPTTFTSTLSVLLNLTSVATLGVCYLYLEVQAVYSFDSSINTNFINSFTVTQAGSVTAVGNNILSLGLASKAFIMDGVRYVLGTYSSLYQSTYFLINLNFTTSSAPLVAAKLAYSNAGGYLTFGLPNVSINGSVAQIPYLYKDLITAANKDTAVPAGTQINGIYSQTGLNLSSFSFGTEFLDTAEIANDLHISGGFLWMYDGYLPVEHNFFLWPDMDTATPANAATWSATGGSMAAQPDAATNTNAYYYQVTYEWTDNQGNAYRSAPSIPIPVTTTGSGTAGSVTVNIPTLRVTMKTANPVKIVIYRWSVAQQIYYQTTSISAPILNDTTVNSITFTDTNSDATILGNNTLYTTGGVIEDVNAPASDLLALFDTRLWLVDSEDRNLLWYSKQVIEATPVEMSDLLTIYVPPTVGTENNSGEITGIFPMDDKLIIAKNNAFIYINGAGPDNTGSNSQYSQPIFITATVGCSNAKSFVLQPEGLMFQSNKGIWLLDRGLNTSYIGAPVEEFTLVGNVVSAVSIPETNQIRFILDSGITLMYDYYYKQWGTFTGVPAVSSCIYENLHTYINDQGRAYQETQNVYLDGSTPVLISFTTGPLRLGDLQNYQRSYFFYLLGTYYSPHKLVVSIAYDYSQDPSQTTILSPLNFSSAYGSGDSQSPYGQGNPYGGPAKLEHYRVFLDRQRCMAFSISLKEIYDGTYDVKAGQGLSLSGINLVMAFKNKFPTIGSDKSFG